MGCTQNVISLALTGRRRDGGYDWRMDAGAAIVTGLAGREVAGGRGRGGRKEGPAGCGRSGGGLLSSDELSGELPMGFSGVGRDEQAGKAQ
jgi:hypothetical protein